MLIIFIAHVPWNLWTNYIPARFGLSDATEMFVFCSGFAAAIAFGGAYLKSGFFHGTVRILHRVWQIYIAHLGMFFGIAALAVFGSIWFHEDYVGKLNLTPFFNNPEDQIVGLFTLSYVPNYFDILPMYIWALVMIPVVMALSQIHRLAGLAFIGVFYLVATIEGWNLPAEPWSERTWFFNPFGWQLIFFTGFALSSGWIKAPAPNRYLTAAAAIFAIAVIPISYWPLWTKVQALKDIRDVLAPVINKSDFGILRLVHFLCLAYLSVTLLKGREHLLHKKIVQPIIIVGQQALPVFLFNMGLAYFAGMLLDYYGRSNLSFAVVNLSGLAIVIVFAYGVSWLKSSPWKAEAIRRKQSQEQKPRASQPTNIAPAPAE